MTGFLLVIPYPIQWSSVRPYADGLGQEFCVGIVVPSSV